MKLTANQKDVLKYISEQRSVAIHGSTINGNTIKSLYDKGLIKCPQYANGYFWELTDEGFDAIISLKLK